MRLKNIPFYLFFICLFLSGCSILDHLDQLSVMGDYARELNNQSIVVKAINNHYDALTKSIDKGQINYYKDKLTFVSSFGDPILKKNLTNGAERWLYRYAIYKEAKTKVYVYFDQKGKLVKWERLACPSFF